METTAKTPDNEMLSGITPDNCKTNTMREELCQVCKKKPATAFMPSTFKPNAFCGDCFNKSELGRRIKRDMIAVELASDQEVPEIKEDWQKEEWNGWKIVSDMLDHPDEIGIYNTSKCYRELYEFVVAQKKKAHQAGVEEVRRERDKEWKEYILQWDEKTNGNLKEFIKKSIKTLLK